MIRAARTAVIATVIAIIAVATGCTSTHAQDPSKPPTAIMEPMRNWKLAFADEFNGTALDQSKWKIGLPWAGDDGEGRHHNSQYASYIVDRDVVVDGGALKLLTRREEVKAKN